MKKKHMVIGSVVGVAVVGMVAVPMLTAKEQVAVIAENELTSLSSDHFYKTISASGTVESKEVSNVYSNLSNYPVESIEVVVGQEVQIGELLLQIDTTNLEADIERKELAIATTEKKNDQSIKTAQDNYNDTAESLENGTNASLNSSQQAVDNARAAYDNAVHQFNQQEQKNIADFAALDGQTETLRLASEEAQANYQNALVNDPNGELEATKELAIKATDAANSYATTKAQNEATKASQGALMAPLIDAKDSTYTAYENSLESYDIAYKNAENSVESSYNSLQSTILSTDQSLDYYDLDALQADLEQSSIYADAAGVVTSVQAQEGAMASGVLVVIQDDNKLQIRTSVNEYDVNSVALGMEVEISSNATGDDSYKGEIISVAPAASADGNYEILVEVLTDATQLKIGMNARVSIILDSYQDVISVPFDTLYENEDGQDCVMIYEPGQEGEYSLSEQVVSLGEENDFAQIISGENITEGTIILNNVEAYLEMQNSSNGMLMPMRGMGN